MGYYIKYILQNLEPLRITNEEGSDGNQVETLRYITGASIRGYVVGRLSRKPEFEEIKKNLLRDVKFKNAYPSYKENGKFRELIPSPRGFYESKKRIKDGEKKSVETILDGREHNPSYKRANLGNFSVIDDDEIKYRSVEIDSALRVKIDNKNNESNNMFRSSFIAKGEVFSGSIWTDEKNIAEEIASQIKDEIVIGHGRYLGYGKCKVLDLKIVSDSEKVNIPYNEYIPGTKNKDIYMMLVSRSVMVDDMGEVCGLNIEQLEKDLNVSDLEIRYCSTSTARISGYNRTWKAAVPSITMYEAGSIFHLYYNGSITEEKLKKVSIHGIGERKNEGCGEVRFLTELPTYKRIITPNIESIGKIIPDVKDNETLKVLAKTYFIKNVRNNFPSYNLNHPIKKLGVSKSQLGEVQSILMAEKFNPEKAFDKAEEFLENAVNKGEKSRTHKNKGCFSVLQDSIIKLRNESVVDFYKDVVDNSTSKIFGFALTDIITKKEFLALKLDLLISSITLEFRKEEK